MKNYALVYHADEANSDLSDFGNDPDFNNPPTWGICRPNVRNQKQVGDGSYLFFIARIGNKSSRKYYLKGYFQVKEKIDVVEALRRFGDRRNVILCKEKRMNRNIRWRNKRWLDASKDIYGAEVPPFLNKIQVDCEDFYQNPNDDHEIDNWKCRRIFNCNMQSFKKCLKENGCLKEGLKNNLIRNYVVGRKSNWADWSKHKVEWKTIAELFGLNKNLMKANKHPEIPLSKGQSENIIALMENKNQ